MSVETSFPPGGVRSPVTPRIEIVEYDPEWPERFECERERMYEAVGDEVLGIEHVGSTAVPGLVAKPIVDICPVVEDMKTAWRVSDLLDEHEWPRVDERGDRPWIEHQRHADDGGMFNVHVRPREAAVENYLLLREYLRDNPDVRDEYARVKREAAREHSDDVAAYTRAKNDVIERAKERAREEGYEERIDL